MTVAADRLIAIVSSESEFAGRLEVAGRLRDAGLRVRPDGSSRKLGKQLESAVKAGAQFAVIVGPDPALVILRDLRKGEQSEVALDELADRVRG